MSTPHNSAEKGAFAKTVLMPGDPLRAKYIAETYLEEPKLVNNVCISSLGVLSHSCSLKRFCKGCKRLFLVLGIVYIIGNHSFHVHNYVNAPAVFKPVCKACIVVRGAGPYDSSVAHFLGAFNPVFIRIHHKTVNLFINLEEALIHTAGDVEIKESVQPEGSARHLRIIGLVYLPFLNLIFSLLIIGFHCGKESVPIPFFARLFFNKSDCGFNLVNRVLLNVLAVITKRYVNDL